LLDAQPQPIRLLSGQALKIVPQDGRAHQFADHYAPRIYMTGEVQTRTNNWHDFFQFLTWLIFPRTKAAEPAREFDPDGDNAARWLFIYFKNWYFP